MPEHVSQHRQEVTLLLSKWEQGDSTALDRLFTILYPSLHRVAFRDFAKAGRNHTLQPTAIVNELYLKLRGQNAAHWNNRFHFIAVCSLLMQRILTDYSRHQKALKRGGQAKFVTIEECSAHVQQPPMEVTDLTRCLDSLAKVYPRALKVIALRYFGGLTLAETSTILKVSRTTVKHDAQIAKAWIARELSN